VFVTARKIRSGAAWHSVDETLEWSEFSISMHSRDAKPSLEIMLVNFSKGLEYFWHSPVGEVIDGGEADLAA
jgi:hypothetical protein